MFRSKTMAPFQMAFPSEMYDSVMQKFLMKNIAHFENIHLEQNFQVSYEDKEIRALNQNLDELNEIRKIANGFGYEDIVEEDSYFLDERISYSSKKIDSLDKEINFYMIIGDFERRISYLFKEYKSYQ